VSVTDSFGRNLLENGDFTAANAHWFFTSDRHHLPWHAKNLWLHVLFEQGWVGLILFSMLTVFALARATAAAFRGEIVAAVLSSSLGGFLVVGLFDSLLDVPRSTFMFFLLLMLCGLVSSERKRRRRKRSGHSAAMAVQSGVL
jgi:O-antigen ligase